MFFLCQEIVIREFGSDRFNDRLLRFDIGFGHDPLVAALVSFVLDGGLGKVREIASRDAGSC